MFHHLQGVEVRAVAFVLLGLVVLSGAVTAATLSVDFMPALFVEDIGSSKPINNITLSSDQNVVNGSWLVLGTNDQVQFALLDTRRYVAFSAGTAKQFNTTNVVNYRYYYILLTDGFPVGSTVTASFNDTTPLQSPDYQSWTPFNFTMSTGRTPIVNVFDFSRFPTGLIANYTIVTNGTVVGAEWYIYGTNTTPVIGAGGSTPALVDYQSGKTFAAGATQAFDISAVAPYQFYIMYLRSGVSTRGVRMEVAFNSGVAAPPVTPTPAPTPVFNVTAVQPLQYTDKNYFYFFGTGALVMMMGALLVRKNEEVFAGLAAVFALVATVISSTTNFSRSFVYYDAPTVFANGTAMTNGTVVVSRVYVVTGAAEVTIIFGILLAIAVVSTIRFYLNKVGEEI